MTRVPAGPTILVTGFGPFPGAPENPTEALMRALTIESPCSFGASALSAMVLPTDYRKSWAVLSRAYARFSPHIVVHFGLSRRADAIAVERFGCRRLRPDRPDAAGFIPRAGLARRSGPDRLPASLPAEPIVEALLAAGFPAVVSENAGGYVCDATLYRSLLAASRAGRLVGFVHVPPEGAGGYTQERLRSAAALVLRQAAQASAGKGSPSKKPCRVNGL